MMGHAFEEGIALLRRRAVMSAILALSLAVPLSLAGVTTCLGLWSRPLITFNQERATVRVLLHPRMDAGQRQIWIQDQENTHPGWSIEEIPEADLVDRLQTWFPYLEDLLSGDHSIDLPILLEIQAADPESVSTLAAGPAVIAVGPTSSVHQLLGAVARSTSLLLGALTLVLGASAFVLATTWIHLEIFRYADEITIMRLVGATESSIRSPFLVAILVPGVVAGLVATAGTWFILEAFGGMATAINLNPPAFPLWVAGAEFGFGIAVAVVAAWLALARHALAESAD